MNYPVNVAHVAGPDGKCARCHAYIGSFLQVADADNGVEAVDRQWHEGERVVEYETPSGRSGFADQVTGFAQDCQP